MARNPRKPRTAKTKPDAPGAAPPGAGDNSSKRNADEVRELFTSHRSSWNGYKAKLAVVEKLERDVKAALKADGFTVKQMEIADSLATVKGEAKVTGEVKDRLQVARWIGHPMGAQLDMFEQPDRTPAADRAFDEGKQASMENKPRKPPHDPSTTQYGRWMEGYDTHQSDLAERVGRGKGAAEAPLSREVWKGAMAEGDKVAQNAIKGFEPSANGAKPAAEGA